MPNPNQPPIRLALCITDLDAGGAERHLVELARRLDRGRFAPAVHCLAARPRDNGAILARDLEGAGIETHFGDARSVLQFPRVLRQLVRAFRAQRPDVVQSFLAHANVIAALAARRAGVPHMLTGIRVAERRAGWHLHAARWTNRLVDRHVCVSQSVADFSRDVGRLPPEKLVVIPNGVDVDRFAAATPCPLDSLGIAAGRRVLAYVGRLDEQKGVDWLLGLMPTLLAKVPEHDLLIVGSGPQKAELEKLGQRLGIAGRVRFAGWRPDIPGILAASDLLVVPSRWEGMPNVVLEAMAAAKAVVATEAEGLRELLGPRGSAQIVPQRDAQLFTETAVSLLLDRPRAEALGRENQLRARENFGLRAMVARYAALYESLLAVSTAK